MIVDDSYILKDGITDPESGILLNEEQRLRKYFLQEYKFHTTKNLNITKGDYADGRTLDKFAVRFQAKILENRLDFLFGENSKTITFEDTLQQLLGYTKDKETLSGSRTEAVGAAIVSRIH